MSLIVSGRNKSDFLEELSFICNLLIHLRNIMEC